METKKQPANKINLKDVKLNSGNTDYAKKCLDFLSFVESGACKVKKGGKNGRRKTQNT